MSYTMQTSEAAGKQLNGLKEIPGVVLSNWPAFFGFSVVRYVSSLVLGMIPNVGGVAGRLETVAMAGAVDVINHVAWEKLRVV